jgi:AcrR family transcriptional regulator
MADLNGAGTTRRTNSRASLLTAARVLFAERGFNGTSTKELAAAAQVTEPTLFRHFPTKVILFEAAVIMPLQEFIAELAVTLTSRELTNASPYDHAYHFCSGLYEVLEENRALIVALIATRTFNEAAAERFPEVQSTLTNLLDLLEDVTRAEAMKRGWDVDAAIVVRLIFGLVFSAAIHTDWLFPEGEPPDRETIVSEMARFTLQGLSQTSPTQ